jgi:glycosyltransferase involved in cell wall biosynthesis
MHVIDSLAVGGAERMLVEIANASAADGHSMSVCITRDGRHLAPELRQDIALTALGRKRRFDLSAMRRFAGLVRKQNVQILQAHSRSTFSFLAFCRALGLIRTPILLHDHYGKADLDSSVPRWFRIAARRYLSGYVGVYQKLGEWAKEAGVPEDRIGVIQNALNLTRITDAQPIDLRAEWGLPASGRIGIVLGGIRREKGHTDLLKALLHCRYLEKTHILCVGRVQEPECKTELDALHQEPALRDRAHFVGERLDAPSLLRGADYAILPSRSESGPLVLIEYLAASLPVVATRSGQIALQAEVSGVEGMIAPGDIGGMTDALDRLLSLKDDEWEQRRSRNYRIAHEYFSMDCVMPLWYKTYREILERSGS